MKLLITYASAGAGHRRVAEAVYHYFKGHRPEIDAKMVDILAKTNFLFRLEYIKGYAFLVRYASKVWHFFFWLTEFKMFRPITHAVTSAINQLNTWSFSAYLVKNNPEYIISTHFLTSEIAANLKKKGRIKSIVVTIITDFGVHPFWITPGTDIYIAASDFTKNKLLAQQVPEENIRVFGLPSDDRFLKQFDRRSLSLKLGLDSTKFTVLLMTGSLGIGPLENIAEVLSEDVQVLVVCASNKKLFNKLSERKIPNVKVFGFVNNTEELMAVSDIIVTKPGGSTISEIINMRLIPVFISMIPGQEEVNAQALAELGIGVSPKDLHEIKDIILNYRDHPEKIVQIKSKIEGIRKPDSSREIASVVR